MDISNSPRTRSSRSSAALLSSFSKSKFKGSSRLMQNATVIQKTLQNTVENFGQALPVLITEALTFADSSAHISARLSPNGWGWVVCGRRLLVWPYREIRPLSGTPSHSTPHHSITPTCYELQLPQTDLAHKADLVCVYISENNQVPSCIGVSPEGMIRWWPSVGREGGYSDVEAELRGQECDTLTETVSSSTALSFILATTTCTVVLIHTTITVPGGRHAVIAKTLSGSGGWFGGIGRRVSSLFFSAMPSSHSSETKLVGIAPLGSSPYEDSLQSPGSPQQMSNGRVCVVAGLRAQLWKLGYPESLAGEVDLQRALKDAFLHSHTFPPGDPGLLDVTVLDIQTWNEGVLMLVSAVNTMRSPQVKYALAHTSVDDSTGGLGHVMNMVPLAANVECGPQGSVRLLATSTHAYLIHKEKIIVVSSVTPNDKADVIQLNSSGDEILGGGLFCNAPLFFSKSHGVISIIHNDIALNDTSLLDSPMSSPHPASAFDGQLSLYELDPRSIAASGAPASEQLKAAFLHHVRKEHTASRQILSSLFPAPSPDSDDKGPHVDSLLDRTLLTIATDLVNDVPASDPRWNQTSAGNAGVALGSSGSLQISPQLQDKRRALSLLFDFCKAASLWSRIGGVTPIKGGGQPVPTALLLRELAEKIAAAVALRVLQQQPQHQHVVDTAIQQVMANLSDEEEESILNTAALSPSDLFYKSVGGVHRALVQACQWCKQQDEAGCEPPALSQLITKVNQVLLAVLQEVLKFRTQNSDFYAVPPAVQNIRLEHTTWTSCPRSGSLLESLRHQQSLSVNRARRAGPELKGELRTQAASLGNCILQMALERAKAFPHNTKRKQVAMKDYQRMRSEIIQPFVDDEEFDEATTLAEKYHDFDMLMLICEKSNNKEKLYHYMDKFKELGFQDAAFHWFMSKGRGGQAALLRAFPRHAASLSHWLSKHHSSHQSNSDSPTFIEEAILSEDDSDVEMERQKDGKNIEESSNLLWLHEMRNGRWLSAATNLLELAQVEQQSVHRMNVQASLSKLSILAAETSVPGENLNELLTAADQRLLLKDYHNLPASLLAHHGLNQGTLRVMEPRDIVDMYITYQGDGLTEYDYVRALELCSLVIGEVADVQAVRCEVAELRRKVWCSTLLADQWKTKDAEDPMYTIQNKLFFKVVDAVHLLECSLDDYLIPLEDLLASEELCQLIEDSVFQYIMRFGYEHIHKSQAAT